MKKRLSLVSFMGGLLALAGCDGEPVEPDAGACPEGMICLDAGEDAGMVEPPDGGDDPDGSGGGECDFLISGRNLGSACREDLCGDPWDCFTEMPGVGIPTVTRDNLAGPNLQGDLFPEGGECSVTCNLDDPGTTCGECGACQGIQLGRVGLVYDVVDNNPIGLCRPFCTPSMSNNGGCREGYTCDVNSGTCVEACLNDMQCRFGIEDPNGDGDGDITYLGEDFPATCNTATARCDIAGTAGVRPGDPCTEDSECEDNGLCLTGDAWPGGYCSRLGCNWPGFECGTGAVCDLRSFGDVTICLDACTVGAEDGMPEAVGAAGHGVDCDAGFACVWDGSSGADVAANGGCIPSEYNPITVPNLGSACQTDSDCYSPFGYGRCFFADGEVDGDETSREIDSGICVIANCAGATPDVNAILPGVEVDQPVCGTATGGLCLNFEADEEAPPTTFCIQSCDSASECAPGYACLAISAADGICWPFCNSNSECRSGTTCEEDTGGACPADDPSATCFCSDRMPPEVMNDGGMPDAGPADAGPVDAGPIP